MARFPESKKLQEHLDKRDRLAFPLLRWIISSCRAHLELVPGDEVRVPGSDRQRERERADLGVGRVQQFSEMNTKFQYVFVSTPPEVEQCFQALKAEHGSILAWHGSTYVPPCLSLSLSFFV
jgi:hypothetical protein